LRAVLHAVNNKLVSDVAEEDYNLTDTYDYRIQGSYRGFPDLRFLLTPMPTVEQSQHQQWITRTAAWIADHWKMPPSVAVEDLYYPIPYNPNIATLTNLFDETPARILEPYIPVADAILACLPQEEVTKRFHPRW
jgi:hypothetical protein